MSDALSIQFLGGVGTVTGSKFLVRWKDQKLLVDCGLFQGVKELRLKNWEPFPLPPQEIDAVIVTHAHLDHIGYLPLLVKRGFQGKIYCTDPTRDLGSIILKDSAKLQEMDADYANRKGFSKHKPALPLYTSGDAQQAIHQFEVTPLNQWVTLSGGARFRLTPSGHILGSAFIELSAGGKTIVFSGDLGRKNPFLLYPPSMIESADYLLMESTYGDRVHNKTPPAESLSKVINDTVARNGHLVIASFAVGRAQDLLYLLSKLKKEGQIPDIPIFLDSPMAEDATEILCKHSGWHRLGREEVRDVCGIARICRSTDESKNLLSLKQSSIVISASGMLSGGRVLFHLENRLPDERNTILLVGFQAAGTRGRLLRDGIPELKMHGRYIPVRARVEEMTTLSAHADQTEILDWLGKFQKPPQTMFLVHGEPQASDALRVKTKDTLGWNCRIPKPMEMVSL